jgi:hypothetical protein
MYATQMPEHLHLHVTVSGLPPVRIQTERWPVIAHAQCSNAAFKFQDGHMGHLAVRQHSDGRTLVYGVLEIRTPEKHERQAGRLLPAGADISQALEEVCHDLEMNSEIVWACLAHVPVEGRQMIGRRLSSGAQASRVIHLQITTSSTVPPARWRASFHFRRERTMRVYSRAKARSLFRNP